MPDKPNSTVPPDHDEERREAAKHAELEKPDTSLIDPEKTPGSGMTPDDGGAPSG